MTRAAGGASCTASTRWCTHAVHCSQSNREQSDAAATRFDTESEALAPCSVCASRGGGPQRARSKQRAYRHSARVFFAREEMTRKCATRSHRDLTLRTATLHHATAHDADFGRLSRARAEHLATTSPAFESPFNTLELRAQPYSPSGRVRLGVSGKSDVDTRLGCRATGYVP